MATKLGTISVDLRANIAQFKSDLDAASANTARTMGQISATMKAQTTEGAQALRFFAASADINVSRPLARILAQTSILGPSLQSAFGVGAGLALASVVSSQLVPTLQKAAAYLKSFQESSEATTRPLADMLTLKEKGLALEHQLAEIGKTQIQVAELKLKFANDALAATKKQYEAEAAGLAITIAQQKSVLDLLDESAKISGQMGGESGGAEIFGILPAQKALREAEERLARINQLIKNLGTESKIAGANLGVALANEKMLSALELMGLALTSLGTNADAVLKKVQGVLPKDKLVEIEDDLKRINAELIAIASFEAQHPEKTFITLNSYTNQLLESQKNLTAEFEKQLEALRQEGMQVASNAEKFPAGIMAGPVSRIPVSPGVQSGADFVRIQQAIARVNDEQARGLISSEEARRSLEHLRREWADLALVQNISGMGMTAALHNVGIAIGNLQQQLQRGWENALGGMHRAFTNFGHNVVLGTRGIGDAFSQLGVDMLSAIVDSLAEMLASWVTTHLLMKAITAIFHTTDVAEALAANTIKTTTGIASNMALALSNAAVAATAAGASVAAIPLVGWSMVPGVVASTYALESAFASMAALAEGGLVTGPAGRDVIPARLSAGEYVLQSSAVRGIGIENLNALNQGRGLRASVGAAVGAGGGGQTYQPINVTVAPVINALDGDSVQDFFNRNSDKLGNTIARKIRNGSWKLKN